MTNRFTMIVGGVMVFILIVYMLCYQVRYDEVGVLTTFDRASEDSIIDEPGPGLKAPWPIQKMTTYSKRVQLLDDQLEEVQTADRRAVIVQMYVAWKISNPLHFFQRVKSVERARELLYPPLRNLKGVISKYRFDELVNTNPQRLKLSQIEEEAKAELIASLSEQGYGIEIVQVGIRRILLPEKVTEKVFESMRQTRQRIAEEARAEGRAKAAAIRSEARSAEQQILAFAERSAQKLRGEGDEEAAQYYEAFSRNQDFAIFLRQIEALRQMLGKNTTFVMDAESFAPIGMLSGEASATEGSQARSGQAEPEASAAMRE